MTRHLLRTAFRFLLCLTVCSGLPIASGSSHAAEIVLPQNRTVFFVDEPLEIAVAGLDRGESATVKLMPEAAGATPLEFQVVGGGSTVTARVPAGSLAPAVYAIALGGQNTGEQVHVVRGVRQSPLYVSQTINHQRLADSGANFSVSNAFSFGILDQGQPSRQPRGISRGMQAQEQAIKAGVPALIYMYYTGYVLHKPWGDEKTWTAEHMTEAMRLFNFHVAQRLRRFGDGILMIGTLDEPGLAWGKTPAGGMASGFPNWDATKWYADRGWKFTQDPASRSDGDWMNYMNIRCAMLGEQNGQARQDIQSVWPEAVFSTDLYAPHAIMDGTDPWNQRVNDVPSTHVFLDWGTGKLGAIGGVYLEKAHDPAAKIAHAMNGQLFGERVPQPQMRYAYHLMLNSMLAAGLKSNWWLNYRGMDDEDLKAVNEPAARIGPLFAAVSPSEHDTALLWSFTEIAMRCKDITAKEAHKQSGEQIKLMVADLPENATTEQGELNINAYSVGGNYKSQVLNMHQSLVRSGYPAHIVHEKLLPGGALSRYKTLVVVGQTFDLPSEVRKAIEEFVAGGGKVVLDGTSTVELPGAARVDANLEDAGYRWSAAFNLKEDQFKSPRAASYVKTNHYMDHFARQAVPAVKQALAKTGSQQVLATDSDWLGAERHVGGGAELIMVINAHEELPELGPEDRYHLYNYAPYKASYTLPTIGKEDIVYLIEGLQWQKMRRVENPTAEQQASFAPGEMKLYLVVPEKPRLETSVAQRDAGLEVQVKLTSGTFPWPLSISIAAPDGTPLVQCHRATGAEGTYTEHFPLGANAPAGKYKVSADELVTRETATVSYRGEVPKPELIEQAARVFDAGTIRKFLEDKPPITIATPGKTYLSLAKELALGLERNGLAVQIKQEQELWKKVGYPRVWDPYLTVYRAEGEAKKLAADAVKRKGTIETIGYNHHDVRDEQGQVIEDWKQPGTLLTVGEQGCLIEEGGHTIAYEAGCKLITAERAMNLVRGAADEVKTTEQVRRRWSRPWHTVQHHVGAHHLVPQLPEAYRAEEHLILLGDSSHSELVRALQASELLLQVADEKYPGAGKALVSFAWSPFAVEKNAIVIAATDNQGIAEGVKALLALLGE